VKRSIVLKNATNYLRRRENPDGINQAAGLKSTLRPLLKEEALRRPGPDHSCADFAPFRDSVQDPKLSQLLEYDWDENLIPVSLSNINYPKIVYQGITARANRAASEKPPEISPDSSADK
jgi:hypothetical protein